ncbi:MAG: hypothetical protein AAGF81_09055 [Pseudomonadota bacterium]
MKELNLTVDLVNACPALGSDLLNLSQVGPSALTVAGFLAGTSG